MTDHKAAMREAVGNLRKTLRDRTGKHKLFTITIEHHGQGEAEKKPEHAGEVLTEDGKEDE